MTNTLTDEELEAFLNELELYASQKQKPKFKVKEESRKENSIKISLVILLSLFLFTLVQAAFTIPLYTKMNRLEKRLEEEKVPFIFPEYPEEEIIEPLELIENNSA